MDPMKVILKVTPKAPVVEEEDKEDKEDSEIIPENKPENEPENKLEAVNNNTVKTGDTKNILLWVILAILSAGAVIVVFKKNVYN